jgi:AmmeMemoRadiSam system protein A
MIDAARQGKILLHHARAALAAALRTPPPPDLPLTPEETDWLEEPAATFVTLTEAGHLRGCIGTVEAFLPLAEDVAKNARAAAFDDPRFPPVTADEARHLQMEVSLLSAPEPLPPCPDQATAEALLQPGRDGVILQYGPHRATFLPQVWDTLPEPREFLHRLLQKARLPAGSWFPEIQLWRYSVRKWKETTA